MVDLSGVKSFVVEKFWTPIVDESVFYNPYNTTVYALLFGIAAYYIGIPAVKKLDLDLDREFFLALGPFVFLGGALRSLKDAGVYDTILLETPLIYFLMFGLVSASLGLSVLADRYLDLDYWKPAFAVGTLSLFGVIGALPVANPGALIPATIIFSLSAGALYLATKSYRPELATASFLVPVAAHYFDATSTVVSLMYGGVEKHVLAGFFIDLMGPAGMFVMKTAIVVPATYYIIEEADGDDQRFLLFVVALLGIALGTRNLLSTVAVA